MSFYDASSPPPGGTITVYAWTFGDGTSATGRKVKHAFPDTAGTLSDGSGKFRVLLDASNGSGHHTLIYVPVVVADALRPALSSAVGAAGIGGAEGNAIGCGDRPAPDQQIETFLHGQGS